MSPTDLSLHRCKVCGTRWLLWPDAIHGGGWNLLDRYQRPGACCDNVTMGEQIEHLRDIDLRASRPASPPAEPASKEVSISPELREKLERSMEESKRLGSPVFAEDAPAEYKVFNGKPVIAVRRHDQHGRRCTDFIDLNVSCGLNGVALAVRLAALLTAEQEPPCKD